ncbi:ATPase domain-containing protein [Hyalangium sp.]|uniref:ATPase domain-containing protein n=1 Tax=Hyalangium sp. TaxID=2028555 RepID=UPI002D3FD76D|nr:ATPase domain-containing protein [Hyalangium sp.]HYH94584.1 ATPase domain-containing protein [Hyalangium sp.]
MTSKNTPLEFQSTGDQALDKILGGGIPARSVVMIAGEPGSGKTVLTLQMLFHAARQGKKCLYFTTLSEPALKVIRYMQLFDFFDVELLDKQVMFVDLGACVREGADRTLAEIVARVEKHEPDFVAIDSFRAVGELLRGQGAAARPFIYDLAVQTTGWGATTLLVGEYTRDEYPSFAEFAVADGILRLGSERQELTSVREMEVLKLRGAGYTSGRHFFDISKVGFSFYPRVSTPADMELQPSAASGERALLGIEGLDELLGGGLPRGSATVVQGATGTGKTLLSLSFLMEGARHGEKGVLFTLEETPDQLRWIARNLGWDLAALEKQGKLVIKYASPVELSTDRFLYEARRQVREMGATRAVFDSLTTMALGVPSDRRYKEMVYAIAKHMRGAGVTLLMTVESEQLIGTAQLTGHGVSFIADNLIQLRYLEIGAKLERAISVIKARGIKHDSELQSLTVGSAGLKVIKGRFKDLRGVLTGLPIGDPREAK